MVMGTRPVILIDFSALFRRAWHVSSEISHAFEATVAGVNRAGSSLPEALAAVCCDGKGNWRKQLAPSYKAQREQQPATMYGEMDRTLDRLRKDGRLIWKFDGFEADDVIAAACMCARTRGHEVRIVSHDKDLLQLLGPGIDFLAIHTNPWEIKTHSDVVDKYGVESTQFADWLALRGDSSDNVKGCPGVGEKTATQLIQWFGDIPGIMIAAVEGDSRLTPNVQKNLVNHREDIATARKLVSLSREVPLRFDEIYEDRQIQDIDERDSMSEAEQDAEKYFGKDAPKDEAVSVRPEAAKEQRQPEAAGSEQEARPNVLNAAGDSPAGALVSRDKTPEEAAEVSRPIGASLVQIEYAKQLEPRNMRDASIYADLMFQSRIYSRYPTRQSILAAIVRGRETGYGAGASLDIFHVCDFNYDGNLRLMMHAHLIIDRVMRDSSLEYFYFAGGDDTYAEYKAKVKRNPEPQTFRYTIEDATKAGLVRLTQKGKPNNWMKIPREQLRKTAGVQFGRIVAPGAAIGLYCMEEMGVDE